MGDQPAPKPDLDPAARVQRRWEQLRKWWPVRIGTQWVLLPLIGVLVSGIIVGRLADSIFGPKKYVVVVVGDESDASARKMLVAAARPFTSVRS